MKKKSQLKEPMKCDHLVCKCGYPKCEGVVEKHSRLRAFDFNLNGRDGDDDDGCVPKNNVHASSKGAAYESYCRDSGQCDDSACTALTHPITVMCIDNAYGVQLS
ncbi:hypothetical protein VNO77_40779 [Canavalia gladiata]|uniref:Uncharacterized protein n=1 Tax=Canavalia gladiata TaxID=3824 RepID=A0AAN9K1S4_CANGL